MQLSRLELEYFSTPLPGAQRCGAILHLKDSLDRLASGEVSPLPGWSDETLAAVEEEFYREYTAIMKTSWDMSTYATSLKNLNLSPSLLFGLESALLSLLDPLPPCKVQVSALLMGSYHEIVQQAQARQHEGFTSAKVKISQLSLSEAYKLLYQLKDTFRLRVDVNRAWDTTTSLHFFEKFPLDAFDYIEEPFQNPRDLKLFTHPLAIDESFPKNLSLEDLEKLPTLKALVYKPTLQGGLMQALPLHAWTKKQGLQFVLSSSFENTLGLTHIAAMAHRLSLTTPIGVGTYAYLSSPLFPLTISQGFMEVTQGRLCPLS